MTKSQKQEQQTSDPAATGLMSEDNVESQKKQVTIIYKIVGLTVALSPVSV